MRAPVRPVAIVLAVAAVLAVLTVAGRLTSVPSQLARSSPSAADFGVDGPPRPSPGYPPSLLRPLRLPRLGPGGACPTTPPVRAWPYRRDVGDAVAVGDGPVVPVFVRDPSGHGLRPLWISWQATRPLGGTAIVRAVRLGPTGAGPVAFDEGGISLPVKVLDETLAHPVEVAGRTLPFWMSYRLEGGRGCYGLQIDGPAFSQVVVVELTA